MKQLKSDSQNSYPNVNALWGTLFVETLVRLGLRDAVISPGSRSTPLVCALAEHTGVHSYAILDERTAGFFALGRARVTGRPVLLVCTSGTAGANYLPAVIEAREDRIPLLVVTADRPPVSRHCRSGQTIDQTGLFGRFPVHCAEISIPSAEEDHLRHLRQSLVHAWTCAADSRGGPVHLNMPFYEPLAPVAGPGDALPGDIDALCVGVRPCISNAICTTELHGFFEDLPETGIIIAGGLPVRDPALHAAAVHRLSNALGWPVLADALSVIRFRAEGGAVIAPYDLILRNSAHARTLIPEGVIQIGPLPTSKILREWLSRIDAQTWVFSEHGDNLDPVHARSMICSLPVEACIPEQINPPPLSARTAAYSRRWLECAKVAEAALDRALDGDDCLFEGRVARELARWAPEESAIFWASSMPVRDAEWFCSASDRRIFPFGNRGANGIDGTLGTAMGIAARHERPVFLLCGDLALLHDTNAFLAAAEISGSLTVVLLNNNGGGIFEHLPVAVTTRHFERFFATPQNVDFSRLVSAYGVHHSHINTWSEFREHISSPPPSGVRVLEWTTHRKRDAEFRKQFFESLRA